MSHWPHESLGKEIANHFEYELNHFEYELLLNDSGNITEIINLK